MLNLLRHFAMMVILAAVIAGCAKTTVEEGQTDAAAASEDPAVHLPAESAVADEGEPTLMVTIDEEKDIVALISNRDMDRGTVEHSIQTTIHDAWMGRTSVDYLYAVEWLDDRSAAVRFKELIPETAVGFMLDDARTTDGKPFAVVLPEEGRRVVTVHAGAPWSGIRWTNAEGQVVREQAFGTAVFIQPACCDWGDGAIAVYHPDGVVDRLHPDSGDVTRTDQEDWLDVEVGRWSDSGGFRDLHAYAADGETYYISIGFEHVYLVDPKADTRTLIYRSEDASLYGLASSPDGSKVAVLTDTEGNLGSYADLRIFDAKGNQLSYYEKAAYIGHSEGWHFVYPMAWQDNDRVAVPFMGRSGMPFDRGKGIYDVHKGLIAEEASGIRPESAISVLKEAISDWGGDANEILRLLPQPGDGVEERLYAAHVSGKGTYLIDVQAGEAIRVGAGSLLGWTSDGDVLTWYSSEGKSPEASVLD